MDTPWRRMQGTDPPRDRRFLGYIETHAYHRVKGWKVTGAYWVECWWDPRPNYDSSGSSGKYRIWCGNPLTRTSESCNILKWAELPQ